MWTSSIKVFPELSQERQLVIKAECTEEESSTCARLGVNRPSDAQDTVGLLLLIVESLFKQNRD